jgi:hypothetical protein
MSTCLPTNDGRYGASVEGGRYVEPKLLRRDGCQIRDVAIDDYCEFKVHVRRVLTEKSDPHLVLMQYFKDRQRCDRADSLRSPTTRGLFVQAQRLASSTVSSERWTPILPAMSAHMDTRKVDPLARDDGSGVDRSRLFSSPDFPSWRKR